MSKYFAEKIEICQSPFNFRADKGQTPIGSKRKNSRKELSSRELFLIHLASGLDLDLLYGSEEVGGGFEVEAELFDGFPAGFGFFVASHRQLRAMHSSVHQDGSLVTYAEISNFITARFGPRKAKTFRPKLKYAYIKLQELMHAWEQKSRT